MNRVLLAINDLLNPGPAFILALLLHDHIHPVHLPRRAGARLPDQPETIPVCAALQRLSAGVDLLGRKPGEEIVRRGSYSLTPLTIKDILLQMDEF